MSSPLLPSHDELSQRCRQLAFRVGKGALEETVHSGPPSTGPREPLGLSAPAPASPLAHSPFALSPRASLGSSLPAGPSPHSYSPGASSRPWEPAPYPGGLGLVLKPSDEVFLGEISEEEEDEREDEREGTRTPRSRVRTDAPWEMVQRLERLAALDLSSVSESRLEVSPSDVLQGAQIPSWIRVVES